jgi:tripartite-type tricarboxylate transporter receptor subunit TctC
MLDTARNRENVTMGVYSHCRRHGLSAIAGCLLAAAAPAGAADMANPFKDKPMRFITMGSVGGGYDAYMRTVLTHLEKKIGARIQPVNENAAGGLVAMNRLINAPADGAALLLTSGEGTALGQLLGNPGVRYDVRKLVWLARVSGPPKVVLVGPKAPYKTFAEVVKSDRVFVWGGTGKTDGNSDYQALLGHTLGFKMKNIHGYKGSRGMNLAIEQGEIDARLLTDESASRATRSGKIRALVTLSRKRSEKFPEVPTVFEQVKMTPTQEKWLDWRANLTALGRVIVTTPGTAKDRVDFLRAALKVVLTDAAYIAEAKKRRLEPQYLDGAVVQDMVMKSMSTLDDKELAELKHVVLTKYYTK